MGLLFLITDNAAPGVGRDTLTFGGGPAPMDCQEPFFPSTLPGIAITSGEITIIDTPSQLTIP
jgi:hypothetical protein